MTARPLHEVLIGIEEPGVSGAPEPAWFTTYTGRRVDLGHPRPADVELEDVAHHLAHLCRFGGASRRFYSVAEHSVLVSYVVTPALALVGLLHDAHEAYLGDVVSPHKRLLGRVTPLEAELARAWDAAIGERLGVDLSHRPEVQEADLATLHHEMAALMPRGALELLCDRLPPHLRGRAFSALAGRREVMALDPVAAERVFIARALELAR